MNTSELRKYIEETLQEVYSEKQRRWACAQTGDDFKGDKELTDKEAEEMCSSPIEEKENTMKLTVESLKQIIKEELGYGNRDDNDPMDIEDAPERTALRVFDEAIESIDAEALKNLTAAISSLALNHGYTIDDVVDVLEANENSGVSVAMKDDEVVATRELEECGYPEEEEEEPKRYFEI